MLRVALVYTGGIGLETVLTMVIKAERPDPSRCREGPPRACVSQTHPQARRYADHECSRERIFWNLHMGFELESRLPVVYAYLLVEAQGLAECKMARLRANSQRLRVLHRISIFSMFIERIWHESRTHTEIVNDVNVLSRDVQLNSFADL